MDLFSGKCDIFKLVHRKNRQEHTQINRINRLDLSSDK